MTTFHKQLVALGALALTLYGASVMTHAAHAATFRTSDDYILPSQEAIPDDAYILGKSVTVSGAITGDVLVAGGTVIIDGTVTNDAIVAGVNVSFLGPVGDDIRSAAGQTIIQSAVGGDVVVGSGLVHILSDAIINGSVIVAGQEVIIDGIINENLEIITKDLTINGTINGRVEAEIGGSLTVGDTAHIGSDLVYSSISEADIASDAVIDGLVVFNVQGDTSTNSGAVVGAFFAIIVGAFFTLKLIALLISGALAVTLFKQFSEELVTTTQAHFLRELFRGFIFFFITPITLLILLASVAGTIIALIFGALYISMLLVALIYSGVLFGGIIAHALNKSGAAGWQWALLGIILLSLIGLIPVIGFIITAIFFLTALGYLNYALYNRIWLMRD